MAEKTDKTNLENDEPREQDADNLKRMKQVVRNVMSNCYANLSESLSGCSSDFANKMLSEQLITDSVMRRADFNDIIRDYKAGINTIFKYTELQTYCSKLLDVLRSLGGPAQRAADYLESELNKSFQAKFGHCLFPQTREKRINSSPSVSSCPPTTKRPYASDGNFSKTYTSEMNAISDQPSVTNNQITEESTSPNPSCPTISKSTSSVPDGFVSGKSLSTTLEKPTEEDSGVPHTVPSDNFTPDITRETEKENDESYLFMSAEETSDTVSQRRTNETVTTNNKPDTNPPSEQLSMVNDKEDNPSYTNSQEELHGLNNEGTDTKSSCIHVPQGPLSSQLPTQPPQNNKIKSDEHQQPIAPIAPIQVSESTQHQASPDNIGIHKRKRHVFATSDSSQRSHNQLSDEENSREQIPPSSSTQPKQINILNNLELHCPITCQGSSMSCIILILVVLVVVAVLLMILLYKYKDGCMNFFN